MEKTLVWRSRFSHQRSFRNWKNSGTIMNVKQWEKWFLVSFIALEAWLVVSCNDSLGEFIRRTLNTVTLLKFTDHWDVMGLMRQGETNKCVHKEHEPWEISINGRLKDQDILCKKIEAGWTQSGELTKQHFCTWFYTGILFNNHLKSSLTRD